MNPICFYHKADLDGVCSAAIVKHFVPDCELHGIDYGDEFPWDKVRPGPDAENDPLWADCFKPENGYVTGGSWEQIRCAKRAVYMVDFSLKPEGMKRLSEVSNLVWCDHHRTAIDGCREMKVDGVRDTRWAACELTWWHFTDGTTAEDLAVPDCDKDMPPLPEAVRLLGAYDSWRKDDPEWESKVLPFQYGCRSLPGIYDPTCYMWQNLCWNSAGFGVEIGHMIDTLNNGRAILAYQAEVNRRACEVGAYEFTLKEFRAIACNTIVFNSRFFEGFYDPAKHDIMIAYCQVYEKSKVYRGNLGAKLRWKVSLYSTQPAIDCGAIAKQFGGGGHKGAARFECDRLPWEVYA